MSTLSLSAVKMPCRDVSACPSGSFREQRAGREHGGDPSCSTHQGSDSYFCPTFHLVGSQVPSCYTARSSIEYCAISCVPEYEHRFPCISRRLVAMNRIMQGLLLHCVPKTSLLSAIKRCTSLIVSHGSGKHGQFKDHVLSVDMCFDICLCWTCSCIAHAPQHKTQSENR